MAQSDPAIRLRQLAFEVGRHPLPSTNEELETMNDERRTRASN